MTGSADMPEPADACVLRVDSGVHRTIASPSPALPMPTIVSPVRPVFETTIACTSPVPESPSGSVASVV